MNNANSLSKRRAARNLGRLLSGDMNRCEAEQGNPWRSTDTDYRDELLGEWHLLADLESLVDDEELLALVDDLPESSSGLGTASSPEELSMQSALPSNRRLPNQSPRKWGTVAIAAAIVLLALTVLLDLLVSPSAVDTANTTHRYVTQIGEIKTITLADGSVINLNTGTELLVTTGSSQRLVTLRRGEAFFTVVKDPVRPFAVEVGEQSISVLGTAFNVRKYPDRLQLAVREGLVAVHPKQEAASATSRKLENNGDSSAPVRLSTSNQIRVPAGWVVELEQASQELVGHPSVEIDSLVSWRQGVLAFNRLPLSDIVKELNRYSAKKILIEDSAIMELEFSAVVNISELDMALKGMESALPIAVTHYFDRIVMTGRKEK